MSAEPLSFRGGIRPAFRRLIVSHPRAADAIAASVDQVFRALPRRDRAGTAFAFEPPLPFDVSRAARSRWSRSARYRVLSSALGAPGADWPDLRFIDVPDVSRLEPPMVIVTLHLGPLNACAGLIRALPAPTLAVTVGLPPRPGLHTTTAGFDRSQRILASAEALQALRADRFVFVAADALADRLIEMPVFGRRVGIGIGAFKLARIADVPLLPVAARWRASRGEIVVGEPVPAGPEADTVTSFGSWIEQCVLDYPVDLGPNFFTMLQRSPLAPGALEESGSEASMTDLAVGGPGDRAGRHDLHAMRPETEGTLDRVSDLGGSTLG